MNATRSAAAAAFLFSAFSFADEPSVLDPLVVTATGAETRLSQIAPSTEVLTRADIERLQANDLADLLRGIAGVDIARSGPPGSPASVFIRGAESNHTLFLVDGVRYTTETFLNAQIQNLAPEAIERIEVVKGPRSALWGSDAIGGVVQIITRKAAAGTHGSTALRGGSFGTRDFSGSLAHGADAASGALAVEYQDHDGYPARTTGTEDRGHDNLSAALNGSVSIAAARVGLRHWQAEGTNEYVDFGGAPAAQDFENGVSALEVSFPVTTAWTTQLRASLARDELTQRQPNDPARPSLFDFTEIERRTAEWENRWTGENLSFTGALSSGTSDINSVFFSGFGDSRTEGRSERHAAFAQLAGSTAPADWLVAVRGVDHDEFGSHVTGNAEAGFAAWHGARAAALAGTAFKEPELTDLYGSFGNPELEPESSRSFELNLRQALGEKQALTAAVFETRIRDLVTFDNSTFTLENIQRARIRGLELGWRYESGAWSARLSGSLQDPEDEDSGEQLLRRSKQSAQAQLDRRFGRFETGLETQAYGPRRDFGGVDLPGYGLLHAHFGFRATEQLSVSLRGENLLDRQYELVSGFRTPERSGYLTVRAGF